MKVYRIVFYAFTVVALYNYVYVTFFQESTYFCYVREYHNSGKVYPTYSSVENTSNKPDFYEITGIPTIGKYLNIIYIHTYPFVIVLFFPLLAYGLIMFFTKKKYKYKKWWVFQLIGYVCLFYIVVVLSNNM